MPGDNYVLGFLSSMPYFGQEWWDRHLACHFQIDRQDACPTNTVVTDPPSLFPVGKCVTRITNWTTTLWTISLRGQQPQDTGASIGRSARAFPSPHRHRRPRFR